VKLRDLGELGLIARIERLAGRVQGSRVVLGIGDDAALLRPRAGETLALTTDACVEGVHFRFGAEPPARIGRRALTANLSDLAAMGARPLAFTLALAAPPGLDAAVALALVRGAVAEGAARGCPLVGGNVTRASETSLTIAALGTLAPPARALRRSAARPGDRLLVTGRLGSAALDRIRAARRGSPLRHQPEARLAAGRALARLPGAGACIDVSDGFLPDLRHLLEASGVGAEIRVDALPRAPGFAAACRALRLDPEGLLLAGGEDYELLFTLRPRVPTAGLARRLGVAVSEVGRITAGKGRLRLLGSPPGLLRRVRGWRHFAAP
jgi:thiamine-monophosphate kinase